jgi:non-specific serine/threonine protein kinase
MANLPSFTPIANLPTPLTPLVGREREVSVVSDLVQRHEVRLLTLTGPGGVGKTRLALHVTARVADAFPQGVAFVGLASITDPALVAPAIAQALGVRDAGDEPLVARLAAFLGDQRLLLVLDNFEQVVAAAPVVADLLTACPHLTVLVTSRVRLRVSGEREYAVPPLEVSEPTDSAHVEVAAASGAVRLFVARAEAVKADFTLTPDNAASVTAICRRLDGLPLALELAAAWVKVLPPAALLARLERRLPLLTGGGDDLPVRQRTMQDTIAWSFDLLSPAEQALFRRLAIFTGGFTLAAAEAVGGGDGELDVLAGVASLVDKSLVQVAEGPGGEPRYLMLETVREFGWERLAASGDEPATQRALAAHLLALADRDVALAWGGPQQERWLERLKAELPNLRAVLAWLDETGDVEAGLRLVGDFGWLWHLGGHRTEGRVRLEHWLSRSGGTRSAARATALGWLASLDRFAGGTRAAELAAESLALWRELGDARGIANALLVVGSALSDRADYAGAVPALEEAAVLLAALGDPTAAGLARMALGGAALDQGDTERAEVLLTEALAVFRHQGFRYGIASSLLALGWLAEDRKDTAGAAAYYAESLGLWGELGTREGLVDVLIAAAGLAANLHPAPATRLLAAATALGERLGYLAPPLQRSRSERAAATARASLGEHDFATASAAGRVLAPEQAVAAAAMVLRDLVRPPEPGWQGTAGALTPRELDVLRLLVAGKTNPEIADALYISPRTAETHVTHILAKLGVTTRAEAAAHAVRVGLA